MGGIAKIRKFTNVKKNKIRNLMIYFKNIILCKI